MLTEEEKGDTVFCPSFVVVVLVHRRTLARQTPHKAPP
jgi:hypothetical protein